ncbi:MAG: DUF4349 domain-containing protein [Bacteroidales bacterium]|nr:DUF4349 domain-containing protein [Bacteroidales bacterium]
MKQLIRLFFLTVLITSCHQKRSNSPMYDMAGINEELMPITRQSHGAPHSINSAEKSEINKKKIIKDGRLGIEVNEIEKTKSGIDTLVRNNGGYYASENFSNTDYESSYDLKIRIPADNFEKLIAGIESGDGKIIYKEIDARDVTEEFIDMETRLLNKRNYLKRYNDLLHQAKTVKDILEIEEKTRVIEEEIESTEGRLKYLSDLVSFSTLDLMITKKKNFKFNPLKRDKFTERLKQSLSKGWFGFVDFFLFLIKIWPLWIILAILIPLWKKLKIKKKKKQ